MTNIGIEEISMEEIKETLESLELYKFDSRCSRKREYCLYLDVLFSIAKGCNNYKKLAREALKAQKINFDRWDEQNV